MIQYEAGSIALAAAEIGRRPHIDILREYLPEILKPVTVNAFSGGAEVPFKAAVFNMEQGRYLNEIIAYFKYHPLLGDTGIIFASEVDCGMGRTGNQNIAGELAGALKMNYAFGTEFLSVDAWKNGNETGLHGNAIFSRFPLERVKLVHLPLKYEWFNWKEDRRLGMRMAVLAEIRAGNLGPLGLVSVHLESRTDPRGRLEQMRRLLEEVEIHFGRDMPVLIGGDLNTLTYNHTGGGGGEGTMYLADHPGEQWRRIGMVPFWEPLLDYAASLGFSYDNCNIMEKPTCRGALRDGRSVFYNLDWFLQRGLACSGPARVETIFHLGQTETIPHTVHSFRGREMSDHDIVLINAGPRN